MRHIDLFSGIGGFALAVDEVWHEQSVEHIFCEIDPFCQAVLKKHWKGSEIYGDIRGLTANTYRARSGTPSSEANGHGEKIDEGRKRQPQSELGRQGGIDILTGGFPCQPFSQAGKRRGTSDNRFLWPEMLRVIRAFSPTWVIAENVRGLLTIEQGVVFEQVCLDLEGEGYEVQPFVIPAVAVNAPHRRDRVWFVANRTSDGCGTGKTITTEKGYAEKPREARKLERRLEGPYSNAPDTSSGRRESNGEQRHARSDDACQEGDGRSWEENWLEVATEFCRVDDGLPAELDEITISRSRHRVERLKALGNAIVPQVAIEIMKAIKATEIFDD